MLGDTAVAINPLDPRAARLHPRNVKLPLTDREIPIVLDDMADPEFGSGAVKITPAHDPNDFEAGKRHDLPSIQVIGEDAKMTAAAGQVRRAGSLRSAQAGGGGAEGTRVPRKDRALQAERRQVPSLQDGGRAAGFQAVVDEDEAAGGAGHRGGGGRTHHLRARQLVEDLFRVDVQHPRLVHFAPVVVGPSHSGVVLRRLQRRHGGARRADQMFALRLGETHAGNRRARHVVQLRAVAVLDARLAGRYARICARSIRRRCWSPASTSSFSGPRA